MDSSAVRVGRPDATTPTVVLRPSHDVPTGASSEPASVSGTPSSALALALRARCLGPTLVALTTSAEFCLVRVRRAVRSVCSPGACIMFGGHRIRSNGIISSLRSLQTPPSTLSALFMRRSSVALDLPRRLPLAALLQPLPSSFLLRTHLSSAVSLLTRTVPHRHSTLTSSQQLPLEIVSPPLQH